MDSLGDSVACTMETCCLILRRILNDLDPAHLEGSLVDLKAQLASMSTGRELSICCRATAQIEIVKTQSTSMIETSPLLLIRWFKTPSFPVIYASDTAV
jgi:hypothetical protein